jgi:hypothetical protein
MVPHSASASIAAPNKYFSSHERMEVYARQYWWRLRHALDEDVPTVMAVLRPSVYKELREAYLVACPSESFTLRELGHRLPLFIKENPQLAGSRPELAFDAAYYDMARVRAFDAASVEPLTREQMEQGDSSGILLGLQPHVQLCRCSYPVHTLLRGENGQLESGRIRKQSTFLVICREKNRVVTLPVTPQQFQLLEILEGGSTLFGMAEVVAGVRRFPIASIASWFWEWCSREWITTRELSD